MVTQFNVGNIKFSQQHNKLTKAGSIFYQILVKHKLRLLKFCQRGEISPNLAILVVVAQLKCAVVCDARRPGFESSYRQLLLNNYQLFVEKTNKKKKRSEWPIYEKERYKSTQIGKDTLNCANCKIWKGVPTDSQTEDSVTYVEIQVDRLLSNVFSVVTPKRHKNFHGRLKILPNIEKSLT